MADKRPYLPAHHGTDDCWRCINGLLGLDATRECCSCPCHYLDRPLVYRGVPNARRKSTRSAVYVRDKYRCRYCGVLLNENHPDVEKRPTLDHVMPKSRGGENTLENLVTSCFYDNSRKSDRTPEEARMTLLPVPPQ